MSNIFTIKKIKKARQKCQAIEVKLFEMRLKAFNPVEEAFLLKATDIQLDNILDFYEENYLFEKQKLNILKKT